MDSIVKADFSRFGYRELAIAGKILEVYAESGAEFLGDGITVNFNTYSGYVFLSDEDYNIGVLDETETRIVQFYSCPKCGYEGTQADAQEEAKDFEGHNGFCSKECELKNR